MESRFVCGCEIIGRGVFKLHFFIGNAENLLKLSVHMVTLRILTGLNKQVPLISNKGYI